MGEVISYLGTRNPTDEELCTCPHFELTSSASWDLYWTEGESLEDCYGFNREVQAFVTELSAAKQMCPMELMDDILPHVFGAIKVRTLTGTKMDK